MVGICCLVKHFCIHLIYIFLNCIVLMVSLTIDAILESKNLKSSFPGIDQDPSVCYLVLFSFLESCYILLKQDSLYSLS